MEKILTSIMYGVQNIKKLILLLLLAIGSNFFVGCSTEQPTKKNDAYIEILFTDVYFRMGGRKNVIPAKIISHSTTDTLFLFTNALHNGNNVYKSCLITALNKKDTVEIKTIYGGGLHTLYPLDTLKVLFTYTSYTTRRKDLVAGKIEYLVDSLDYQNINKPVPKVICKKAPSLTVYFQDISVYRYYD